MTGSSVGSGKKREFPLAKSGFTREDVHESAPSRTWRKQRGRREGGGSGAYQPPGRRKTGYSRALRHPVKPTTPPTRPRARRWLHSPSRRRVGVDADSAEGATSSGVSSTSAQSSPAQSIASAVPMYVGVQKGISLNVQAAIMLLFNVLSANQRELADGVGVTPATRQLPESLTSFFVSSGATQHFAMPMTGPSGTKLEPKLQRLLKSYLAALRSAKPSTATSGSGFSAWRHVVSQRAPRQVPATHSRSAFTLYQPPELLAVRDTDPAALFVAGGPAGLSRLPRDVQLHVLAPAPDVVIGGVRWLGCEMRGRIFWRPLPAPDAVSTTAITTTTVANDAAAAAAVVDDNEVEGGSESSADDARTLRITTPTTPRTTTTTTVSGRAGFQSPTPAPDSSTLASSALMAALRSGRGVTRVTDALRNSRIRKQAFGTTKGARPHNHGAFFFALRGNGGVVIEDLTGRPTNDGTCPTNASVVVRCRLDDPTDAELVVTNALSMADDMPLLVDPVSRSLAVKSFSSLYLVTNPNKPISNFFFLGVVDASNTWIYFHAIANRVPLLGNAGRRKAQRYWAKRLGVGVYDVRAQHHAHRPLRAYGVVSTSTNVSATAPAPDVDGVGSGSGSVVETGEKMKDGTPKAESAAASSVGSPPPGLTIAAPAKTAEALSRELALLALATPKEMLAGVGGYPLAGGAMLTVPTAADPAAAGVTSAWGGVFGQADWSRTSLTGGALPLQRLGARAGAGAGAAIGPLDDVFSRSGSRSA